MLGLATWETVVLIALIILFIGAVVQLIMGGLGGGLITGGIAALLLIALVVGLIHDARTLPKGSLPSTNAPAAVVNPASGSGGNGTTSQVYTFQWISGDLFGEHGVCHIMISDANGNVNVPASHGTIAKSSFNAASKAVYDSNVADIQSHANPTGPCDIVAQPSSLPFS